MSSIEGKRCINCSADLTTAENKSAFYTLNCSSRVRSPLSPATVELIPVPHALATIFNFQTLEKISKSNTSAGGGDSDRDQDHDDGAENVLLEDFQSSASSVPMCFVCYLVLSDLYKNYAEFSQLRKKNSFLSTKLVELENGFKMNSRSQPQSHFQSSLKSKGNRTKSFNVSSSSASASTSGSVNNQRVSSGADVNKSELPLHRESRRQGQSPAVQSQELHNLGLEEDDPSADSIVKLEVFDDVNDSDYDPEADMDYGGGVTEDEEGEGGDEGITEGGSSNFSSALDGSATATSTHSNSETASNSNANLSSRVKPPEYYINEETDTFLNLVESHSYIYDPHDKRYHSRDIRSSAWQEIGRDCNMTGKEANKKYVALRDKYTRIKNHPKPAGSKRKKKSRNEDLLSEFMARMAFLDRFTSKRRLP